METVGPGDQDTVLHRNASRTWVTLGAAAGIASLLALVNGLAAPSDPGFRHFQPNPLFLAVTLLALVGGTRGGVAAGAAAAAATLCVGAWTGSCTVYQAVNSAQWRAFVLGLILTGGVIGALADSRMKRYERLRLLHRSLLERFKTFDCSYQLLKQAKAQLERQVRATTSAFTTVYDDARRLFGLPKRKLLVEVVNLLNRYAWAESLCIYEVTEKGFHLVAELGHADLLDPWPDLQARPVLGYVSAKKRMVTVRDALQRNEAQLAGVDALAAAPILGVAGRVEAVVTVEKIPFIHFDRYTLNTIALICEWAGMALAETMEKETLAREGLYDPESETYREEYFLRRMEAESRLAKRYGIPFSVLVITGLQGAELKKAARLVKGRLRHVDCVAIGADRSSIFVLLPMTDRTGAELASKRLREELQKSMGLEARIRLLEHGEDGEIRLPEGASAEQEQCGLQQACVSK